MNWFKRIFHTCKYFKWEIGYGYTPFGLGRYDYKVCRDCEKILPGVYNFTSDKQIHLEK